MKREERISQEKIEEALKDAHSFYQIEIKESVTSTNDLLMEAAKNGGREGMVLIAEEQTKGRGRQGKHFFSPLGSGLYMSILLRPTIPIEDVPLLTPMTAVAVAEAMEKVSSKKVGIKWVNDIFLNGKKICGILTEGALQAKGTAMDYVVVGIGINVTKPQKGFPDDLEAVAGALWEGEAGNASLLCAEILRNFRQGYARFSERTFLEEYKNRLFFLGKKIDILSSRGRESGVALDINDRCHLLVKTESGEIKELDSGEIHIKL